MKTTNRTQAGFTIYELLMVLVIAGVALAVGMPALADFTQNNRTSAQINDMVTSIISARSEALSRGRRAAVLPVGGDWANGWEVRVDVNRNSVFTDGVDQLVRQFPPLDDATLNVNGADIVFLPTGWPEDATRVVTVLADNCRAQNQRQITMSNTGILTTTKMACP